MKADNEGLHQTLDRLLRKRFHGAVNIRGIRYQILFSIFRAFDLYQEDGGPTTLRLEGIEDVDLIGLRLGDEYVQVKSSDAPWNWSRLKKPIQGFVQAYRADHGCRLALAVNFPLRGDIAKLAQSESLSHKERERVRRKFRGLCSQGGASRSEADGMLNSLSIVSLPEEEICTRLPATVADAFGLGSEAVNTYILALVGVFLEWAQDRREISRLDLDNVRIEIGEALSRETEFQAHGRGIIDRISWEQDAKELDFFEGKGTSPGHIAAGVDVRRATWLNMIDRAVNSLKVCVIRSSSGQGKSALLYRYAYESWEPQNTFILRFAESPEHVELARNHFKFRSRLGMPLLLLIDHAGWKTRLWPSVAQACSAFGVRVLVTVRNEDWFRFARESLVNYEIIEPKLDLEEATHIFRAFQSQGRIHPSLDSPEWAYEKVGEPRLLMEYVYLLTHGHMLEDRLRDQLKQFSEQGEDPAKVEILRRTALSDALGAPVLAEKLLRDVSLRDDPQQVLQSLEGEYIRLEAGIITGLHWVRSDHLVDLLHEKYPNAETTALATLQSILPDDIPTFVSNAMVRRGLDTEIFRKGLIEQAVGANADTILAFLDGVFQAGERQFFGANQDLFDEAYELLGQAGPFLLSSDFMPVVKLDILDRMADIMGDRGENFRKLKKIASRACSAPRGLELCRDFLMGISPETSPEMLQENPGASGRLLDWCALCKVAVPAWREARERFPARLTLFDLSPQEFCQFAQGMYRHDEPAYQEWFSQNRDDILGYLKFHMDCIDLHVRNAVLSIRFLPDAASNSNLNEQAVSRLRRLRAAIPFCDRYQSQGIWIMPFGLRPSIDETRKDMPRENLPLESDIEKNMVWRNAVNSRYLPDSYYRYEEAWHRIRQDALAFVNGLSQGLQRILAGKRFSFESVFKEGELLARLDQALRRIADPPPQAPTSLRKVLMEAPKQWSSSLHNFLIQFAQYLQDTSNQEIVRLMVHNFLDTLRRVPEVRVAFAELVENAPDYFSSDELSSKELKAYTTLADLLEVWLVEPVSRPHRNILKYVRERRKRKRQDVLRRLRCVLSHLEREGIGFILPSDVHLQYPLRYLPLAFSVEDPCYPESALLTVIGALADVKELADFFCLVPMHAGARFVEGGYCISSSQISELKNGHVRQWESLVPRELPGDVLSRLPPLPFRPSPRQECRSLVLALLGGLRSLIDLRNEIKTLKTSRNRFEIELYQSYLAKLRDWEQELGDQASIAMDRLTTEFSQFEDSADYEVLRAFLDAVKQAVRRETLNDFLATGRFDSAALEGGLERLLNLSSEKDHEP